MAKSEKEPMVITGSSEAFEIIELAIDDIDVLTRAFEVIAVACADEDEAEDCDLDTEYDVPAKHLIN
ncbi:MAG: hypothetical protein K1X83_11165 [Oligoflexia bacterium]|nr:hypothetical protein [Oligoflexia bacterium]